MKKKIKYSDLSKHQKQMANKTGVTAWSVPVQAIEEIGMNMEAISRILKSLEEKGFISRQGDTFICTIPLQQR